MSISAQNALSDVRFEDALRKALGDLHELDQQIARAASDLVELRRKRAKLMHLAESISENLDDSNCETLRQELARLRPSLGGGTWRRSPLYENVVSLITTSAKRDWSTEELHSSLGTNGKDDTNKALHNIIGYLVKTGRLRRIARGRYHTSEFGFGLEDIEEVADDGE